MISSEGTKNEVMTSSQIINVNGNYTSENMNGNNGNGGGCDCTITEDTIKRIADEYIDPNELSEALQDYVHRVTYESKINAIDYNLNKLQADINTLPTFGTINSLNERLDILEDKPDYNIANDLTYEYKTDDILPDSYEIQEDFKFKSVTVSDKLQLPDGNGIYGITDNYK